MPNHQKPTKKPAKPQGNRKAVRKYRKALTRDLQFWTAIVALITVFVTAIVSVLK